MKRVRLLIVLLAVSLLPPSQVLLLASPPPVSASCRISCTVANVVEWSQTNFPDIELGELTEKNNQAADKTTLTLYTNGSVTITADNSNNAELSLGPHTLLTRYKLKFDGAGVIQTGGKPTAWRPFDTFLKEPADIVHIPADGALEVILSVEASITEIRPENSGQYSATQTLTVCWVP